MSAQLKAALHLAEKLVDVVAIVSVQKYTIGGDTLYAVTGESDNCVVFHAACSDKHTRYAEIMGNQLKNGIENRIAGALGGTASRSNVSWMVSYEGINDGR
ncbi:hypothetical protein KC887_08600 [Candidatus Kaiserbacteria bacterium]|nr:hypothetical protein [Candidatus Kaiserbacteria bacterium]